MTVAALGSSMPSYAGLEPVAIIGLVACLAITALVLGRAYKRGDAGRQARWRRIATVLAYVVLGWVVLCLVAYLAVKA